MFSFFLATALLGRLWVRKNRPSASCLRLLLCICISQSQLDASLECTQCHEHGQRTPRIRTTKLLVTSFNRTPIPQFPSRNKQKTTTKKQKTKTHQTTTTTKQQHQDKNKTNKQTKLTTINKQAKTWREDARPRYALVSNTDYLVSVKSDLMCNHTQRGTFEIALTQRVRWSILAKYTLQQPNK